SAKAPHLERFLADLDGALGVVPRDVVGAPDERTVPWPQWVWQPSDSGPVLLTAVAVAGKPAIDTATLRSGSQVRTAARRDPGADVALSDIPTLDGASLQPLRRAEGEA